MHSNVNGLLLIDKPTGPSSYDIIRKIQKFLPKVKIGHGGTLDPLASGLLILGLGPSTKSLTKLLQFPKTYLATIRLGYATDTDDSLGDRIPLDTLNVAKEQKRLEAIRGLQPISTSISPDRINLALKQFLGPQMQVPPQFSAKLVNGKRAYALARAGAHIELDPKEITIYDIKLLNILSTAPEDALADIQIELTCSSGTYVRALARDLGNQLGTGAHITQLRRTKIGNYSVTEAIDAENFILSDIITNKIEKNHSPNNLNAIVKEMKTINTFYESVTCIGKFDGVHIGHQKMLSTVAKTAKSRGLSSIAIVLETGISRSFSDNNTYSHDHDNPDTYGSSSSSSSSSGGGGSSEHLSCSDSSGGSSGSGSEHLSCSDSSGGSSSILYSNTCLTTLYQRQKMIHNLGIDQVVIQPCNQRFLNLTAEEFIDQVLYRSLKSRAFIWGPDQTIGSDQLTFDQFQKTLGSTITSPTVEHLNALVKFANRAVSTSSIRQLLNSGDIPSANRYLGRPYAIRGYIEHNHGLGHKIGFPTANLTKVETIIPTEGVYNCRGYFRNKVYKAAVSIGSNYTFNATHPTIEAYLLDAPSNINLYGKYLTLEFNEYLRPMRKFANAKELSTQISEDVKQVLES